MKSARRTNKRGPGRPNRALAAFTLAEVLAAMLFMAIVIPVAVEGLHIASRAGTVAARKGQAARVAERILNENLITTNWFQGNQSGTVTEGAQQFHWTLQSDPWTQDPNQNVLRQLTAVVEYTAQGSTYSVKMSTLVDSSQAY